MMKPTARQKVDLQRLLAPRSIVVIGASEKEGVGANLIENLRSLSFQGAIYPVNPNHDTVLGLPCFPSVERIPAPVDFAAICLRASGVIPAIEECSRKGISNGWAFASGFGEAGQEGQALQAQLRETCERTGFQLIGPNCVGFANLIDRVATYSAPLNPHIKAGKIGAIAQSGSLCLALANSNRSVGFSKIISTGNEAVLDSCDYLEYLLEDPYTEVILSFIEGFRQPKRLIEVAKRSRAYNKPILLVKVGRSTVAQHATLAHTGALTGSDRVQDALFRQLGLVRLDDLDELLETAILFQQARDHWPRGDGVGLITVSGGEIGLIADLSEPLKLSFPALSEKARRALADALPPFSSIANPLDAWGAGDLSETYPRCMEILAQDPNVDVVAVSLDATSSLATKQSEQYSAVARAAVHVKRESGKNVVLFSNLSSGSDKGISDIVETGGVPMLQGTRESLLSLRRLFDYARFLQQPAEEGPQGEDSREDLSAFLKGKHGLMSELEAKRILRAYGIRTPKEELVRNTDEAVTVAHAIGWPVTLKVQSKQIAHKTEVGGVVLNVRDEAALRAGYRRIMEHVKEQVPTASIEGILVSEMINGIVAEVIVGISQDRDYGPVVAFGLGGILVELLQDVSLRLPPISKRMAGEMIEETLGSALLKGFRGKPAGDLEALRQTLVQIGRLAIDWGQAIFSMDINPLLVLPDGQGVVAVDSLIELR
jgi:acyl-CoA synthetase (NDP forming)